MQNQDKPEKMIQVSFKTGNMLLKLEKDIIQQVDTILERNHQSIERKKFDQHQTVILNYKVPNNEIARKIIYKHNLEYTGVQKIHIEEKVNGIEYRGMQLFNKLVLECKGNISLRELFIYLFDKFGEVFRIKCLPENQQQVEVIFRHAIDYKNFLLYLKENLHNMKNDIYFEINNTKITIIQYSKTSINIDKPENQAITENQLDFIKKVKEEIKQKDSYYQNSTQKQGNRITITQFSDLQCLVQQLQKIGHLSEISLFKGNQNQLQLSIRYRNIQDEENMMKAYNKLQFTNLDNLNILITKIRCRYQDFGCTNQSCQFPHIGIDQVTCNNLFYQKCKEYQQNKCEYLHIGPKNILKIQQNNNSNNENKNQNKSQDTNVNFDQNQVDEEQEYTQKICKVCFDGFIQTNYKHCDSSEFCLQCAERILKRQMLCPFCFQKPEKKQTQQSKKEKDSEQNKRKQKKEVESNGECEESKQSQQHQQIQKDLEQQEKYKRLLEKYELIKKKEEKNRQELIIKEKQGQELEKHLRDKIQQLENIIRNKEINQKKQQEEIQKEKLEIKKAQNKIQSDQLSIQRIQEQNQRQSQFIHQEKQQIQKDKDQIQKDQKQLQNERLQQQEKSKKDYLIKIVIALFVILFSFKYFY